MLEAKIADLKICIKAWGVNFQLPFQAMAKDEDGHEGKMGQLMGEGW